MSNKEPVLLTVLIQTSELRWYVAGIDLASKPIPLIRSEVGNLRPYVGESLDEQVNFLRHRLSGVLQRGCDRLWGRQLKPCHIVFVTDGPFQQAEPELAREVGEHFVQWMTSPPVVFLTAEAGFSLNVAHQLNDIAGQLDASHREALIKALPDLCSAMGADEQWELAPNPKK
ncbi:MAG TPA: hypothetical protein P5307_10390 [Pirellulaceae bacterium]|nr:hypothetical protein [Pirellulaceae bacterium]